MPKSYTDEQLVTALTAAERRYPPAAPGTLSKEVSKIAGPFGELVYQRVAAIEIDDESTRALIDQLLAI